MMIFLAGFLLGGLFGFFMAAMISTHRDDDS